MASQVRLELERLQWLLQPLRKIPANDDS